MFETEEGCELALKYSEKPSFLQNLFFEDKKGKRN